MKQAQHAGITPGTRSVFTAEVLSKVKAGRGRTHGKLEGVVWRRLLTGTAPHREIPVAAVRQAEWIRVEGRENHAVWYMVEAVSDQLRSELHEQQEYDGYYGLGLAAQYEYEWNWGSHRTLIYNACPQARWIQRGNGQSTQCMFCLGRAIRHSEGTQSIEPNSQKH